MSGEAKCLCANCGSNFELPVGLARFIARCPKCKSQKINIVLNSDKLISERSSATGLELIESKIPVGLVAWDYNNDQNNSTLQQINRQKSSRHLEIIQFDSSQPLAVFFDHKRKKFNLTSLTHCDCTDFNRQKNVKPCMHIYRVAIEMGLIEPKYFGWEKEYVIANKLSREESERLVKLPIDCTQWGGWASEVHESGIQKNRQYRAYFINNVEIEAVLEKSQHEDSCAWRIHGYNVSLNKCNCPDFLKRKLPCKHIYAAAISYGLKLPLSQKEYESARDQGLGMVFVFDISE